MNPHVIGITRVTAVDGPREPLWAVRNMRGVSTDLLNFRCRSVPVLQVVAWGNIWAVRSIPLIVQLLFFAVFGTCPAPVGGNQLALPVTAGEKRVRAAYRDWG